MSKYKKIWFRSESLLHIAVGTVGPVSVAIDASWASFHVSSCLILKFVQL